MLAVICLNVIARSCLIVSVVIYKFNFIGIALLALHLIWIMPWRLNLTVSIEIFFFMKLFRPCMHLGEYLQLWLEFTLISSLISCDELKSPILFFPVHHLTILKKQIWKSNDFSGWDGPQSRAMIMTIDLEHFFDCTYETLLKSTICSQFCIICIIFNILIGPPPLLSTS